jgi:hypothetical protein
MRVNLPPDDEYSIYECLNCLVFRRKNFLAYVNFHNHGTLFDYSNFPRGFNNNQDRGYSVHNGNNNNSSR